MNEEPGRRDRPRREDLVLRARVELRSWTDTTGHDPGVTLVELLAFVGDVLSTHSERLADEAYLGSGRRRPGAEDRVTIEVRVDGSRWRQVPDLAGSGPQDAHHVISRGDDGAILIVFGDDVPGRASSCDAPPGTERP